MTQGKAVSGALANEEILDIRGINLADLIRGIAMLVNSSAGPFMQGFSPWLEKRANALQANGMWSMRIPPDTGDIT